MGRIGRIGNQKTCIVIIFTVVKEAEAILRMGGWIWRVLVRDICFNAVKVGPDSRGGISVRNEIIFVVNFCFSSTEGDGKAC